LKIEEEIKQKRFTSVHQVAHLNTMFTANWLVSLAKVALKPFGVTHQQYNVLRILQGKKQFPCSADSIKEVMIDKSPDLTRLLDRLIDKGYVSRSVCEANRRKLDIVITERGMALLKRIKPKIAAYFRQAKKITDQEAIELSRILDKMRGSLEETSQEEVCDEQFAMSTV